MIQKERGGIKKETYKTRVRKPKTVLKLIPGKKMETSVTATKATFIAKFIIPHMPAQGDQNASSVWPWNVKTCTDWTFPLSIMTTMSFRGRFTSCCSKYSPQCTQMWRGVTLKGLQEMPTVVTALKAKRSLTRLMPKQCTVYSYCAAVE